MESSEEVSGVVVTVLFPELELLLAVTFFDAWKYWFNLPLNVVFLFTGTSLRSHSSCLYPCWVSTAISGEQLCWKRLEVGMGGIADLSGGGLLDGV